ncbi:MAG TPA: DUF6438 domain-containing protein [Thermodesulfovibrionales bacterium]|nr:DUF6438 domain-containing protein [Thermodesulfovibrionales bacterium]
MKKTVVPIICIILLLSANYASGSLPVPVTITGCVKEGVMFSEETDFGSHVSKGRYEIRPVRADWTRVDLSPYDGNIIQVKGDLLPGDRFIINPENIRIMGRCANLSIAPIPSPNSAVLSEAEDVMITLERTICFGTCPAYKLTVYGNGTVEYEGKDHVKTMGRQTYAISREKVKELIYQFKRVNYFSLNDSYEKIDRTDFPYAITSIRINGKSKTIRHYRGDNTAPRELAALERKIDEIAGSARWIKGDIPEGTSTDSGLMSRSSEDKVFADRLWDEGRALFGAKRFSEALSKFSESVKYWSNASRFEYVETLGSALADRKSRARILRSEGLALESRGDFGAATEKYNESLKYWQDPLLERHISNLKDRRYSVRPDQSEPHDDTPCGLLDIGQVTVPEDFVISTVSGPVHAEWGGKTIEKVFANGNVIVSREKRTSRFAPPELEDTKGRISPDAVRMIYAYVTACDFFGLNKDYRNPKVMDGGYRFLEVTANGRKHSVSVYYFVVERFNEIESILREEIRKMQKY